mgnify:CR=1 FL=1
MPKSVLVGEVYRRFSVPVLIPSEQEPISIQWKSTKTPMRKFRLWHLSWVYSFSTILSNQMYRDILSFDRKEAFFVRLFYVSMFVRQKLGTILSYDIVIPISYIVFHLQFVLHGLEVVRRGNLFVGEPTN